MKKVDAESIEHIFGQVGTATRFASFCNAVLVAEAGSPMHSLPVLSEKPGPDGSFDGEWEVPSPSPEFCHPFAQVGWNVFQFKARSTIGSSRKKAVSDLKRNLKGAAQAVEDRLEPPKELKRYVLFTNLQLGLKTKTTTKGSAILSQDRIELETAIQKGSSHQVMVQIIDAAQLASLVNKHPALRLTYFSPNAARTWEEKWGEERAAKNYHASAPLIGREREVDHIAAWIADPSVKVIAISGPSGMGKTRLALETTLSIASRTTVVDVVAELERAGLPPLDTSAQVRIIIVEDPSREQAVRLARQAIGTKNLKLLFTFPSEAKTPQLKLTEHDSVKQITLQPLPREASKTLLKSTGKDLDSDAQDWIVQQAGGVPEILLSAAELGTGLREKSDDLKRRLVEVYCGRIEAELGAEAIVTLRLLSTLHWVSVSGEKPDLPTIIATVGLGFGANAVLNFLKPLEQMGHLRRRGDHVSVVPPLFAAALSEEQFQANICATCQLFDSLPDASRKRLLERMVTTDMSDRSSFWDHVLDGELGTIDRMLANLDLLGYVARAIPLRAARFLEGQFDALANSFTWSTPDFRRDMMLDVLRELSYTPESCALGMRLLQKMATRQELETDPSGAAKLFCECFVHWYFAFPLSFQTREAWIRRMLSSTDRAERHLACHAVIMATRPPHALSAYNVNARRLGENPAPRQWREVHDYLAHLLDLRLELAQDQDSHIAHLAARGLAGCFQEQYLPPDQNVSALEKFMELQRFGKLNQDEREIRQAIHWIENRYRETSVRSGQATQAEKWKDVLERIAALRRRLDEGPLDLRLKIALGPGFDYSWEEVEGKRVYGFERRCQALAEEIAQNPALMTESAWRLLKDRESRNAHVFIIALGAADTDKVFLARFEAEIVEEHGNHNYGLYLAGVQQRQPEAVDDRLDELSARQDLPKRCLLKAIQFTGPTLGNRRRLLGLVAEKSVEPKALAEMFTTGKWLDDLPPSDVSTILEFIGTSSDGWPQRIIVILALYLHSNKPLPTQLVHIAERALVEVDASDGHILWYCDQVAIGAARANIRGGLDLLRKHLAPFKQGGRKVTHILRGWTPLHGHGRNDFWEHIREVAPEEAYREILPLPPSALRSEIGQLIDIEKHRDALLRIAQESTANAELLSQLISGAQPEFFPFSYSLMRMFPQNDSVSQHLGWAALYSLEFGFGEGDHSQALAGIENQMKSAPAQFLPWLQNLRTRIQSEIKQRQQRRPSEHDLGWE